MRYRWLLVLLLVPLLVPPSQAGIIFGRKKDRPEPKTRVPELIAALKDDKDADKRGKAAEELRNYDPAVFPEIVPALIGTLNGDAASGVRIEAAHSLSRLRPVSQTVGEALEQSVAKDSSMRVRLQSRNALLQYHWAGYRGKKTDVPPLNATTEPPLAGKDQEKAPPAINTTRPVPIVPPVETTPSLPPTQPPTNSRLRPPVAPVETPKTTDKDKGKEPHLELPPVPPVRPVKPEARPMPPVKPSTDGPELP